MADAMTETEKLADLVFQSVKVYVDRKFAAATAPLIVRMDASEKTLAEWRAAFDEKLGSIQRVEQPTEVISRDEVKAIVEEAVAAIDPPKGEPGPQGEPGAKGADGKDAVIDQEAIDAAVEKAIAAIEVVVPDPIPGKDGEPGPAGKDGAVGPAGENGADAIVDYDQINHELAAMVAKAFAEVPKPENGRDGRDGDRGPSGRDASDLAILASIDPERIYALGTWARHRGGLWKASRDTDEMREGIAVDAGWMCVVEGFAGLSLGESSEDGRTITVTAELSSGRKATHSIETAAMIYRGIYEPGRQYAKGDVVTFAGSMLIAQRATSAMPETPTAGDDWKLAVKRGQNGKDADGNRAPTKCDPVRL